MIWGMVYFWPWDMSTDILEHFFKTNEEKTLLRTTYLEKPIIVLFYYISCSKYRFRKLVSVVKGYRNMYFWMNMYFFVLLNMHYSIQEFL